MLANLEGITIEAAFILKDLHRHMEDPVVVRRLRDVGQKFATNRRTVVLTAPKISIPPELASLVEYVELPLPDRSAPTRPPPTRWSSAPAFPASINCSACVTGWVFRSRCWRQVAASEAPGTGTATPVRDAIRKATPIVTRSPMS